MPPQYGLNAPSLLEPDARRQHGGLSNGIAVGSGTITFAAANQDAIA